MPSFAKSTFDPFSGLALYRDVEVYDSFGVHRTGLEPDRRTSVWLHDHLDTLGFKPRLEPFTADIYEAHEAAVSVDGAVIPVVVQEPVVQDALDLEAPIVSLDVGQDSLKGAIALVELPYAGDATISNPTAWPLIEKAAAAGAAVAIAVTNGPTGELIFFNTPKDGSGLPLPILLAAPKDAQKLRDTCRVQAKARIKLAGAIRSVTAYSLISHPSAPGPAIVISTPQSAWTRAAGERGVGIALWRAIASYAAAHRDTAWMFVSTSGHELAHRGLGTVFRNPNCPRPNGVRLWIHLGANIATYARDTSSSEFRLSHKAGRGMLAVSKAIFVAANESFGKLAGLRPTVMEDTFLAGEARQIVAAGYRPVAGFFGPSVLHHTPLDRATIATGPDILSPIGDAMRFFLDMVLQ